MEYLSISDVQDILKSNKNTVYKLFHKKNFPAIKLGGKYIVEKDEFKKYMEKYTGGEIIL